MKIIWSKNLSLDKKLLLSYLTLFFSIIFVSILFTAPLVKNLVEDRTKKELQTTINIFHSLVKTGADLTIKNHLTTIVSTNLSILHGLNSKVENNEITLEEAKEKAKDIFQSQKIGKTGYIYTINNNGIVVSHPKKGVLGNNLSGFEFIKKQLTFENGFIEYKWKNPEDKNQKEKALYYEHFKPWGWRVSASSYKTEFLHLLKIEDLRKNIETLRFGNSGYAFIINNDGTLLIHPNFKSKNIADINPPKGEKLLNQILTKKTGKIEYLWKNPKDSKFNKKIVYFKFIERFNLIICASGYKDELYRPVYKMAYIFIGTFTLLIMCIVPLTIWLSRSITRPLETFIDKIKYASKGNLSVRISENSLGEIGKLAKYFNIFMDELSSKTKKLEQEIEERKSREEQVRILAKFPDDNPNPVLRINQNFILSYFNMSAVESLKSIDLKVGIKIPDIFASNAAKAFEIKSPVEFEYSENNSENNKTYSFHIYPFEDIKSAYIYGQEITVQKAYESLMILSDAFFENSIEGICITDTKGCIESVNPLFSVITGYSEQEVIGQNPRILKSNRHDSSFYQEMWRSLVSQGQWAGEIWNRRKNGQAYPEWLNISAIKDKTGKTLKYIGVFHDITESLINKEKIMYQTYHDATTGLPNRKLFTDMLTQNISSASKKGNSFAILFIDINNFKNINDTLGHLKGDNLLTQFADKLKTKTSQEMIIARFVGDKFIILIPDAKDQNHALKTATKVQNIVYGPYKIDDKEIFCGTNIGISFYPSDGQKAEILIKNAEMAMYRGKNKGKRSISFFTASMDERAAKRLETEHNLAKALNNNELTMYYQPKVSLLTGKITGAEALIRWITDTGIVSPGLFIPVAEETGFIIPIGEWIMDSVCQRLKILEEKGYKDIKLSLNLSGVQFQDSNIYEMIENTIKKHNVNPSQLKFEITESVVMSDPQLASNITNRLKDLGASISIDDFGTGYSSLGYLKKFPVDELKIDKSFLDDFPQSNDDLSIIKAVLSLAANLDLSVVAEGIETEVQCNALRTLGCDEMQGYFFSKPLPEKDFFDLLDSGKRLKQIKTL